MQPQEVVELIAEADDTELFNSMLFLIYCIRGDTFNHALYALIYLFLMGSASDLTCTLVNIIF